MSRLLVLGLMLGSSALPALDLRRYELLEDLSNGFRKMRHDEWVKSEKELILARSLFELKDSSKPILDEKENKELFTGEELEPEFAEILKQVNETSENMSATDKKYVRETFHRHVIDELLKKVNSRKSTFWNVRERLLHDTNVSQTAESIVQVSNQEGNLATTSFRFRYLSKDEPYGQVGVTLGFRQSQYLTKQFRNRDSRYFALGLSDKFRLKKHKMNFVSWGLDIRGDWLRSTGAYDYSFTTYTPKMDIMFMPKKYLGKWSDLLVGFVSSGLELKEYTGPNKVDFSGFNKNTSTPFLTFILMNLKKWEKIGSRSTFSILLRNQNSDSDDFNYNLGRVGFASAVIIREWNFTVDLGFSYRDQKSFSGSPRRDKVLDPSFIINRKFFNEVLDSSLGVKYTTQDSNIEDFNFESTQAYIDLSVSF